MTLNRHWREITPEETAVAAAIVSAAKHPASKTIIDDLDGAVASPHWIIDIRTPNVAPVGRSAASTLPDGPFPARAFVTNGVDYQGEVIVWIKNGQLSGLEYAWISDKPPTRWPHPDEMEVFKP